MEKFLNIKSTTKRLNEDNNKEENKRKFRKYDDSYLDFGFTYIKIDNEERPKCVICLKVLAADSMIPNKLKRHFETNHGSLINKKRDYFVRQREQLEKQSTSFIKQTSVPTKALLASYKVAFRVAQSKKPHTIAEELILPSAIDMVSTMIGESAANQLKNIPLSNNTISRRIHDISENINEQLISKLKNKNFAIQLDEATDSNKDAHLICYIRFMDKTNIIEALLFCKPIFGDTKAQTLFDITNDFMNCNNINWENCLDVCTDGARAMAGHYGGLQALIRKKAPEMIWTHCIIHRESLASQNMCPSLNTVLQTVIKVVNYIKTRPVKARFFKKICEEMGAEHTALLFYCNSRWLSKGNVLIRVFELRQELYTYLSEEGHNDFNKFIDSDFVIKLAYLCDIFEKLNILNTSLQGKETHILQLYDKVVAFIKKIELWQRKLTEENGKAECFSFLKSFLEDNDLELPMSSLNIISDHLMTLKNHFEKYFPEDIVQYNWIKDPFSENPLPNFTTTEEEQLIDISSDSSLRMKFSSFSLLEFWSSIKDEYSEISNKALRVLLPFATSYLCEAGFSAVAVLKSKYRSKLNIEKEMRVAVTTLLPNFEEILNKKQAHCSH